MNLSNFLRKDWLALLLMLAPAILILLFWSQLPNPVPIHWGLDSEVNGYQSKATFLWFTLGTSVFVYVLTAVAPYIDPKVNVRRIEKPFRVVRIATMAFLTLISGVIVLNAIGYPVNVILVGNLAAILLFLVLGNLMAKFPPNYFAGIRTPWTLESPEVWRQVHRVASKLWVAGSLILLLFVFRLENKAYFILFAVVITVLVIVPMVHSYLLYQSMFKNFL